MVIEEEEIGKRMKISEELEKDDVEGEKRLEEEIIKEKEFGLWIEKVKRGKERFFVWNWCYNLIYIINKKNRNWMRNYWEMNY